MFFNIFHVSLGRTISVPNSERECILYGIAINSDKAVARNSAHHFMHHHGTKAVVNNDNARVNTISIERGMSICCIVLSM